LTALYTLDIVASCVVVLKEAIMNNSQAGSVPADAIVDFLGAIERAIGQLRRRTLVAGEVPAEDERVVLRGDRQEEIARLPDFFDDAGLTAQDVADKAGYDEANTYSVLKSLEKAGVLEVIEGSPRRWRHAEKHRTNEVLRAGLVLQRGEWSTYGDFSVAVYGNKGGARAVGRIAATNPAFPNAYRVLDQHGRVKPDWSGYGGGPERCRELLESEGVSFEDDRADRAKRIYPEEIESRLADQSPT
jgi:alkylated DNA nucleotide flippase Atl1